MMVCGRGPLSIVIPPHPHPRFHHHMLLVILTQHRNLLGYLGVKLVYWKSIFLTQISLGKNIIKRKLVLHLPKYITSRHQFSLAHLFSTDSGPCTGDTAVKTRDPVSSPRPSQGSQISGKVREWMTWNSRDLTCIIHSILQMIKWERCCHSLFFRCQNWESKTQM